MFKLSYQNVLLHPEALSDSKMVEEWTLLDLHRQVDDGHVRVVEQVQNIRFAKIETFKLKKIDILWIVYK